MKKVTLLCGLLIALCATVASAAPGVAMRWDACYGGGTLGTGATNKNFACNTNSGSNVLVGSFQLGSDLLGVSGVEIVVDVATAGASLPAWWTFKNAGSCRTSSLGVGGSPAFARSGICDDWSGAPTGATGGLAAYSVGVNGPNTARILAGLAVAPDALQDLSGGVEYYAFSATITNTKTVGANSCAGCSTPACLVCNSIKVATPPQPGQPDASVTLSGPMNGIDSHFSLWQGGAGVTVGAKQGCPLAVSTHSRTWTTVKQLYR